MAARRQLTSELAAGALGDPEGGGGRQRLRVVEGGVEGLDVGCDEGRDALEAVGGEGTAKSEAPVDADAGGSAAIVPEEALRPEVGLLYRAEPVGGFGVDDVRCCSQMFTSCGVADGEAPGVILRAGQVGAALVRLNLPLA